MFSLMTNSSPFRDLSKELCWIDDVIKSPTLSKPQSFPVDVEEHKDRYVVTAELPGIKKDDISISVEDGVLSIKAEKLETRKEGDKIKYFERKYGSFERSFVLDESLDDSKVEASYNDGVLDVSIPKKEKSKPTAIKIK